MNQRMRKYKQSASRLLSLAVRNHPVEIIRTSAFESPFAE
ncbi:hypothetical protein RISK_003051 [Rhodopirellula islandica]|uniref:Uncharacterized protein n=1 Tax=Rhodopirellula islandica TaxID=595434 RepID=A0A0J1BDT9_RHOIS|nr:hypothetical protein RISK_003051 [Rhodopirellula islandica]